MPGGKPRYYTTVDALETAGEAYFVSCDAKEHPYTITGLALALGFTSRKDLINYEGYGEEYYHAIRAMKLRCEDYAARVALSKPNQAGAIFVLKNHGWRDDQHHELTGAGGGPLLTAVTVTLRKADASSEEEA